jgi:hypothetical protein
MTTLNSYRFENLKSNKVRIVYNLHIQLVYVMDQGYEPRIQAQRKECLPQIFK